MVCGRNMAEVSASKIGTKANVPAETTPTETDVFEPAMVDIPEDENVSQCYCEIQTTFEQIESEDLALVVSSVESKENKVDAVEEEEIMNGHAEEGSEGGEEGDFDDDEDENENGDDDDVGVENDYADDGDVGNENDYDDGDGDGDEDDDGENDSSTDDFGDYDDYDENGDMMDKEDDSDEDHAYHDVIKRKEGEVNEETRKEKHVEGGNRSSTQKVKPLRKESEKKKVKNGSSNEVTSKGAESRGDAMEEEDNQEGGRDDAMEKEENQEGQNDATEDDDVLEDIGKKRKGSSMLKDRKLLKRSKGKGITAGGSEKEATKQVEKPESQSKKMSSKKVASMGMVFMCSSKTKRDCYHYKILGLPDSKRDLVEKIYKGMRLFLYDIDLKLLYGIYKAAGRGGYNIQPKAFNSHFPSQIWICGDALVQADSRT